MNLKSETSPTLDNPLVNLPIGIEILIDVDDGINVKDLVKQEKTFIDNFYSFQPCNQYQRKLPQ